MLHTCDGTQIEPTGGNLSFNAQSRTHGKWVMVRKTNTECPHHRKHDNVFILCVCVLCARRLFNWLTSFAVRAALSSKKVFNSGHTFPYKYCTYTFQLTCAVSAWVRHAQTRTTHSNTAYTRADTIARDFMAFGFMCTRPERACASVHTRTHLFRLWQYNWV